MEAGPLTVVVTLDRRIGGWRAWAPEYPGCCSSGGAFADVLWAIQEAVDLPAAMEESWQPPNRLLVQLGLGQSGLRGAAEGQLEPRLTVDPEVLDGRLCVRHQPVAVADVLQHLAGGATGEALRDEFAGLEPADVRACLGYAALLAESAWPMEPPPPLVPADEPEEWLVHIRRRADALWEATCDALPGWRIVADNPDIVLAGLRDAEAMQSRWAEPDADSPLA